MFEAFPKLTRFSHDWTVTEKVDGSNGQILIQPKNQWAALSSDDEGPPEGCIATVRHDDTWYAVFAGSRNKLLDTSKQGDHAGFAKFVAERAEAFVKALGPGRHFGEWYGKGIQRNYGLSEKRFMLFNPRWKDTELPDRVDVAPVIFSGYLHDAKVFDEALHNLKAWGSLIAPGFMNPEGIVMYHGPSRTLFKKTFDYDEQGKWAENQARKAQAA